MYFYRESFSESFGVKKDLNELERKEQDDLDIRCLQVLRALIHNQIVQKDPETKESNPKEYRRLAGTLVALISLNDPSL